MMIQRQFARHAILFAVLLLAIPVKVAAAVVTFSAAGSNAAAITPTVDSFRSALGGGTVAGANGSFGGARREINWDGVPDAFAAPNNLPLNFFNVNSPRGVVMNTPGTGVQVSANAGVAPVEFANINATYPTLFAPFSPQRLFTPLGSNIVDVSFFVPGTTQAALVRGFGSVFSDVDLANLTSIQLFGAANQSLGTFFVLPGSGNETFSFLGLVADSPSIGRVRITTGNSALGPNEVTGVTDLVVMDDWIYAEPLTAAIPEPATSGLIAVALAGLYARSRARGRVVLQKE
jgi:hypothetical protein